MAHESYESLLRRRSLALRFPRALEEEYRHDTALARRDHLRISLYAAAALYASLCLLDLMLLRDVVVPAVLGRVAMALLAAVVLQLLPDQTRSQSQLGDLVCTALAAIGGLSISLPLALSHSPSAVYAHAATLMVPLFAGIGSRLPFRCAFVACVLHLIGYVALMFALSSAPPVAVLSYSLILLGATVFALVGSYEMEFNDRRNYLEARLAEQRRREQSDAIRHLESLSSRDGLTGIANRRQFDGAFTAEWKQSAMRLSPLSLLIIDVDFFKHYNDTYGHPQGDVCLRAMAGVMQRVAQRAGGTAARLGGEEFAILLPAHDIEASGRVANEVCTEVRALAMPHSSSAVAPWVTVSVGAATVWPTPDKDGCAALMAAADQALYKAKVTGRDRAMHDGPWLPKEVPKRGFKT